MYSKEKRRAYYLLTKEHATQVNKIYRESHKEQIKVQRELNRDTRIENCRIWYTLNKDKVAEGNRERSKQWKKDNPQLVTAMNKKRDCLKKQRVPSWANLEHIKEIYTNCPEGYHVDHIVPLQGENVSGLHVEYNLQYLNASDNCRKGNIYPHPEFH